MKLQEVILRDTRANQPSAAASNEGWIYFVTDEQKLERSNGSAWESIAPISSGGAVLCQTVGNGVYVAAATFYSDAYYWNQGSSTEIGFIMPRAGIIKNLYAKMINSTFSTGSTVHTIYINGVDSGVSVTIVGDSTDMVQNTTDTAAFSAGDIVYIKTVCGGVDTESAEGGWAFEY